MRKEARAVVVGEVVAERSDHRRDILGDHGYRVAGEDGIAEFHRRSRAGVVRIKSAASCRSYVASNRAVHHPQGAVTCESPHSHSPSKGSLVAVKRAVLESRTVALDIRGTSFSTRTCKIEQEACARSHQGAAATRCSQCTCAEVTLILRENAIDQPSRGGNCIQTAAKLALIRGKCCPRRNEKALILPDSASRPIAGSHIPCEYAVV